MSPIALDSQPGSPTSDVSASSAQTGALHNTWDEPIAIVGMGCRWPGSASNPSALWELLQSRTDTYSDFPESKLNHRGFYHPNKNRIGSFNTKGGYFLNEDPRLFDNAFFGINPLETITLDPAQRKLLEVTYEAFEAAGVTLEKVSASKTGVYIGNYAYDHQIMQLRDVDNPLPYMETGGATPILSNRISYVFNLLGPSLTVDTASSSSLYALHLACQALLSGDCEAAVAGGSNLILSPDIQIIGTKLGTLSPRSRCSTFDASADGYGRGEGFGVLYLKRLSAAVRDGDPIRAVIRGTALNANGKTGGITHPSVPGQESVIRAAYAAAGLSPSETAYFECHGTGTAVGDPIEVAGLGSVFAKYRTNEEPLLIGAIKPNMGHSESAAGFAGIMKAVLAVEKGIIPPTIGVVNENPDIDFDTHKVKIVKESTPWPSWSSLRRISINSFGYGGTNAHCILESIGSVLPGYSHRPRREPYSNGKGYPNGNGQLEAYNNLKSLFVFSAHHSSALKANIASISSVAEHYALRDLSHTLSTKRTRFHERAFAVVDPSSSIAPQLKEAKLTLANPTASSSSPSIGLVFTGQGAQWAQMGLPLLKRYRVFAQSIKSMDKTLRSLHPSDAPSWTIESVLKEPVETSQINIAAIAQPICTALQVALVDLLSSWGIKAAATIGHSSGEIAAAYAAGLLTAPEAIVTAYFRGKIVGDDTQVGAMMTVGVGAEEVAQYTPEDVVVACVNSPISTTLSGTVKGIESVKAKLDEKHIFARILKTGGKAYHSKMMANLGAAYEEATSMAITALRTAKGESLKGKRSNTGIKMFSSVYGKVLEASQTLGPSYWRKNLESPVQFSKALEKLTADSKLCVNQLIEIGPHSALNGPIRQIQQELEKNGHKGFPAYLASIVRNHDGVDAMLKLAGSLWAKDFPVDLEVVNADYNSTPPVTITDLPTYKYNYDGPMLYHENRWHREWRNRKHLKHDVLGYRVPGCAKDAPLWKNVLRTKDIPWLEEHKIGSDMIFPAGGFLAMAIEAAYQLHLENPSAAKISGYELRNIDICAALAIPDNDYGVEVLFSCRRRTIGGTDNTWEFQISSINAESDISTEHCRGSVSVETEKKTLLANPAYEDHSIMLGKSETAWYTAFRNANWRYGPSFQKIANLRSMLDGPKAAAEISMKPTAHLSIEEESVYPIHPATLEATLQLAIIAAHKGRAQDYNTQFLPVSIDTLTMYTSEASKALCFSTGSIQNSRSASASTQLLAPNGETILNMTNTRFTASSLASSPLHQPLRLCYKPDIDAISNEKAREMFQPIPFRSAALWDKLDRLAIHMLFDFHESFASQIGNCKLDLPLTRFWDYIERMVNLGSQGKIPYGPEALAASTEQRKATIKQLCDEVLSESVVAEVMDRMYTHLAPIFQGTTTGQAVCFKDDMMHRFYIDSTTLEGAYIQLRRVMDLLGHQDPCRSILEFGAGTGGATRVVMDVLQGRSPMKRYKDYTFTDVSTYFLGPAQEEFGDCGNVSYKVVSFEVDPLTDPGYNGEKYDMVVASNCLHVGADMHQILRNVRQYLKTGGRLVLVEVTNQRFWAPLLAGGFSDYWNGHEDGRINGPYCPREKWREVLVPKNGFSGCDMMLDDYTDGHLLTSVILSTAVEVPLTNGPGTNGEVKENGFEKMVNGAKEASSKVAPKTNDAETKDDLRYIPRFVPDESAHTLAAQGKIVEKDSIVSVTTFCADVDSKKPGLGGLYFCETEQEQLGAEDVEVEVEAMGLSQQDLDIVLSKTTSNTFLHEFAGQIKRTGSSVKNLKAGNKVVGLAPTKTGFTNFIIANKHCVLMLGPEEKPETMATLPIAGVTAEYGLRHIAGLDAGERVLIHATSRLTPTVIATIQLACSAEADVYISVPDQPTASFLSTHFQILDGESRFFYPSSLTTGFLLSQTFNQGFDVVVSFSSAGVEEILPAMAPLGRWVNASPASRVNAVESTVTVSSIDLPMLAAKKPKLLGKLLASMLHDYRFLTLSPPQNITTYSVTALSKALSSLPSAASAKSVVTYPANETIALRQQPPQYTCDPEGSYVLANCSLELGSLIGTWLAERGVQHLTLFTSGSSTVSPINHLKANFEAAGIAVNTTSNTATLISDPHISGIYFNVSDESDISTLKILAATLPVKSLDFFITHLANTAASSATLSLSETLNSFARSNWSKGVTSFTTESSSDLDELSLLHTFPLLFSPGASRETENPDPALYSTLHIPSASTTPSLPEDPRFAAYTQSLLQQQTRSTTSNAGSSTSAADRLAAASAESYLEVATEILVEKLANLLFLPQEQVSTQKSLSDYGMDSMIAADLRSWMGKVFGVDIPFLELLSPEMKIWKLAERAAAGGVRRRLNCGHGDRERGCLEGKGVW